MIRKNWLTEVKFKYCILILYNGGAKVLMLYNFQLRILYKFSISRVILDKKKYFYPFDLSADHKNRIRETYLSHFFGRNVSTYAKSKLSKKIGH